MLIGVTGYAQHGKDTIANVLVEDFGFTRLAFADALKDLAYYINPSIPGIGRLSGIVDTDGFEAAKQLPEVRRILQDLGTGARYWLGDNVWVDALDLKVRASGENVVISDVRFPNEADYIHRWLGTLWRVHRLVPTDSLSPDTDFVEFDNGVGTTHPSEYHVAALPVDAIFYNGGTLQDLEAQVRRVMGEVPIWARND